MNIPLSKGSPAYTNELYRRRDMLQKELSDIQQEIDLINSQGQKIWTRITVYPPYGSDSKPYQLQDSKYRTQRGNMIQPDV